MQISETLIPLHYITSHRIALHYMTCIYMCIYICITFHYITKHMKVNSISRVFSVTQWLIPLAKSIKSPVASGMSRANQLISLG